MIPRQDYGDGAYIDFEGIAKQKTEPRMPASSREPKRGSPNKVVTLSWILVVSLIISLVIITFLSSELSQANQKIETLNNDLNEANQKIENLSHRR
jgi:cell division protein FtsL